MAKRIGALRWDDNTWEGEGPDPDSAVRAALATYRPERVIGDVSSPFDVFLQVRIDHGTGDLTYRAVLR